MSHTIPRNSYWRLKDQPRYVFKVIGTAIEGGEVRGSIVMYEQQGTNLLDYSWTTESHFLEAFEPDPFHGSARNEPVSDWCNCL
jgi:hypothetical protein